jgi:adenine-specific DNA-methyltransferase
MTLTPIAPKKVLNKAFLKERIHRTDMEQFKAHFKLLIARIAAVDNESEENRKNTVSDFLKSTHYAPLYEINTRGREDLVIHTGKTAKDNVGVLFEIKKPNSSEMLTAAKPNAKALQQLVFYYLRERIEHKNLDIKHLIATDIFNWYVFDENLFDKHIYRNPKFQKGYETFKQSGKDTAFFYNEVAKPLLDELDMAWECTHFNLKDYEKAATDVSDTSKVSARHTTSSAG